MLLRTSLDITLVRRTLTTVAGIRRSIRAGTPRVAATKTHARAVAQS
jgi:hypothetical protein